MIFIRSIPQYSHSRYILYRPLLRQDFQYRCAYCLTHEFFVGGEAGFEIDHHRPINGTYGRPELKSVYNNLYWSCGECNQRKGDQWPSPQQEASGKRFLDPCRSEDDHDLHWTFNADGTIDALTPVAEFTEEKLMLWRAFLVERRMQLFRDQADILEIENKLSGKDISSELRIELDRRAQDIRKRLEPPRINRPMRRSPSFSE